MQTYMSTR